MAGETDAGNIVAFLKKVGGLKRVERFKGQFFWKDYPLKERYESVADHSWRMSMLLMAVAPKLSQKLDMEKALRMCMLHDVAEVVTGDISPLGSDGTGRDAHLYNKGKAKEKFENEHTAIKEILGALEEDTRRTLYELWLAYEKQESYEARVVKAIDKLEGKLQALEYADGMLHPQHLAFTLAYGEETFDVDPVLRRLADAIREELMALKTSAAA